MHCQRMFSCTSMHVALLLFCINFSGFATEQVKGENGTAPKDMVKVGDTIPEGIVTDPEGTNIRLREVVAEKPTVLIFYRGGWCPYCNAHLGKLQTIEQQVRDAGYQIVAVSPDRPEELRITLAKQALNYSLFSDSTMEIAKKFGIAFTVSGGTRFTYRLAGINLEKASGQEHHMLPIPSVFIVATNGIIRFVHSDPDYKVRMKPDSLLSVIRIEKPEP